MHSTNYQNTLITPSADSPVAIGTVPEKPISVAGAQYALLAEAPHAMTSDDLLHAAHQTRGGALDREAFFAKPQACMRASPLVKQFGWGIHQDASGRIALVAMEGETYRALLANPAIRKAPGMRSKRA